MWLGATEFEGLTLVGLGLKPKRSRVLWSNFDCWLSDLVGLAGDWLLGLDGEDTNFLVGKGNLDRDVEEREG